MLNFGIFKINFDLVGTINNLLSFFIDQPASTIIWELFIIGGWLAIVYAGLFIILSNYQEYRENIYIKDWKWVVFAIDIPPINVQTPKAVEQMFAHIAGAYSSPNIGEAFRGGYKQRWFSFEIISIEGYIQFIVRTEEKFRDLVEASIYAQYPEVEITEVEDYVSSVPSRYPNDTHDVWIGDFILNENDAYPIRSYQEFEHNISKDTVLKDPMGTFLESFTRIGPGEQMWFQIIVKPIGSGWKEKCIKKIREIIGDKSLKKEGGNKYVDAIANTPIKILEAVGDAVFAREGSAFGASEIKSDDSGEQNNLRFLTPGQGKLIEAMEDKIGKIGFETKIRGVYVARKEVFKPERGVNAMIGAINQYNIPTANSIVPGYTTAGAEYFLEKYRTEYRKSTLMEAYKKRKIKAGKNPYVLNIEELATIWHFPMSHVATPLVQKASAKRAEPPTDLPTEIVGSLPFEEILVGVIPKSEKDIEKKTNAYQTDAGNQSESNDLQEFG